MTETPSRIRTLFGASASARLHAWRGTSLRTCERWVSGARPVPEDVAAEVEAAIAAVQRPEVEAALQALIRVADDVGAPRGALAARIEKIGERPRTPA